MSSASPLTAHLRGMQKLRQLVAAGAEDRAALEAKYRGRISEMDLRLKEVLLLLCWLQPQALGCLSYC